MSTSKRKYISVDAEDNTTNDSIKMQNPDNEVHGTLFTKDSNNQQADIRNIFIKKDALDSIEEIDESEDSDPGFTLDAVVKQFNAMLRALKGAAPLILFLCGASMAFGADPVGKAKLRYIGANQYVVTQEVDSVFTSWTNGSEVVFNADTNNFIIGGKSMSQLLSARVDEVDPVFSAFKNSKYNISVGYGTSASYSKGVAIGVPALNSYQEGDFTYATSGTGTNYYWRQDYIGDVYANRESVAIGDAAQARLPVSVAIGDQAIVGSLHTDSGTNYPVVFHAMTITTTTSNGVVVSVSTNTAENVTRWYDGGQWERLPSPEWRKIGTTTTNISESVVVTTENWEERESGKLYDISYLTPDEWEYYNRYVSSGQGTVDWTKAWYGVAIGSRAYVFGYHGVAYGHYAHVSRPFGIALGSEAHVYSEGAMGIGYDADIATNSPYSMGIGFHATVPSGMTNAIVIGVPPFVDIDKRGTGDGSVKGRPTAVKSNSINFVYNGKGLEDFYIDGASIQKRLGSEVKVVGNGSHEDISPESVRDALDLPDDNNIVFAAGDGKIMLFTKSYLDDVDEGLYLDEVVINGKPLSEIIGDMEFKRKVQRAAQVAQDEISTNATTMVQVKTILNAFFNSIKE